MTELEFKSIVTMLKAFPKYDPEKYTQNTWKMYYQALKDYSMEDVQAKVMDSFKAGAFIPSPDKLVPEKKQNINWMRKYIEENEPYAAETISRFARMHNISWEEAKEVLDEK